MNKFRLQISVLVLLLLSIYTSAQNKYSLSVRGVDKDGAQLVSELGLQTAFTSRLSCTDYINKLPGLLQAKGYVTVSIDSLQYDSGMARIVLFAGNRYLWAKLDAKNVDPVLLMLLAGGKNYFRINQWILHK